MKIKDLKPNQKNPRKISQRAKNNLKKSLDEFGDLGCIIFNRRTKQLVGAHQRISVFDSNSEIKIVKTYSTPTDKGTVAEGFVLHHGESFKYREVDWDEIKEKAAMIAANKHSGEWDDSLLKEFAQELNSAEYDFDLIGFTHQDFGFEKIVESIGNESTDEMSTSEEESDEDYVKNTKQTTEQIPTERPSNAVFESQDEKKMDVVGKRFVIIIDCQSAEHKESLKEKLRSTVVEAGARFF